MNYFQSNLCKIYSAVTSRRELLLNRVAIIILLYSGILISIDNWIGILCSLFQWLPNVADTDLSPLWVFLWNKREKCKSPDDKYSNKKEVVMFPAYEAFYSTACKPMRCTKRSYSLSSGSKIATSLTDAEGCKTNPYYITGLVDAEGSFGVYFTKYNKSKAGYLIQPNFQITLHKNDYALLETIKLYFNGVGGIYKDGKSLYKYSVRSLKDLDGILNHFEKYPLLTQKWADFNLFKQVVLMLINKRHLSEDGLKEIVAIKAAMNKGLPDSLKAAFPDLIPVSRSLVLSQEIKDPNWLVGFVDGEGCFLVNLYKSPKNKNGYRIRLRFVITQHVRDVNLLKNVMSWLGCGGIQPSLDSTSQLVVTSLSDITEKIIPFFEKYPLEGAKAKDYSDFKRVANLLENKVHLTQSGLDEIKSIKVLMNSAKRKLPNDEEDQVDVES